MHIHRLYTLICAIVMAGTNAHALTTKAVLEDGKEVKVLIHPDLPLTIRLPSNHYTVDGVGLTDTDADPTADLCVAHTADASHLSLRILRAFEVRQINLAVDEYIVGVRLYPTLDPSLATTILLFEKPAPPVVEDVSNLVKSSDKPVLAGYAAATPNILYGLLSKAKMLYSMRTNPSLLKATVLTTKDITVSDREDDIQKNDFYELTLHQVVRTDKYDALSFSLTITNTTTDKTLLFDTTPFSVRVGDYIYWQAISDFEPQAPNGYRPGLGPGESATGFFVIAGANQEGRYNRLAVTNQFQVNVLLRKVLQAESVKPAEGNKNSEKLPTEQPQEERKEDEPRDVIILPVNG